MEEKIKKYCEENNLVCGITDAEPFWEISGKIEEKTRELEGFICADIQKRIDPKKTMENAKSIIVIGRCYNRKIGFKPDGKKRCKLAMGAFGEDYHITLKRHLKCIEDIIKADFPNAECMSFSDTGPLDDRAAGKRAGLGNFGKNNMLITEKFGSAVNIGYVITELELIKNEPFRKDLCRGCRKCIEACPTGALSDGGYDFKKCISYISQKKGELSEWESEALGNTLYGCDICLRACIYNDKFCGEVGDIEEMYPEAEMILSLTNSLFKKKYGKSAIFWRGLKTIKRNAKNSLKGGRIY